MHYHVVHAGRSWLTGFDRVTAQATAKRNEDRVRECQKAECEAGMVRVLGWHMPVYRSLNEQRNLKDVQASKAGEAASRGD